MEITDDLSFYRQVLLGLVAINFVIFALWTILKPTSFAKVLGYDLNSSNAISEFHAIYFGVFLSHAVLALAAIKFNDILVLGDLVAVFLLSQPVGRIVAWFKGAKPQKVMFIMFILETFGGIVLLVVR
jgi:hypothetical protein